MLHACLYVCICAYAKYVGYFFIGLRPHCFLCRIEHFLPSIEFAEDSKITAQCLIHKRMYRLCGHGNAKPQSFNIHYSDIVTWECN